MHSAPRHDRAGNYRLPSLLLSGGVAVTLVLFGLVLWEALNAYSSYKYIQSDERALDRLDMQLTRLNDSLTIDALLAVTTGDTSRVVQFRSSEHQLEAEILIAAAHLDTSQTTSALSHIRQAHSRRVSLEESAMQLAYHGDRNAALQILSSDDYLQRKREYVASIEQALDTLNDREESNAKWLRTQLTLVGIYSAGVLLVAWLSILRVLQVNFRRRREAEKVVRESEARFRGVIETAFDELVLSDNGVLIETSGRLANLLGYSREELTGRPVADIVAPEFRDTVRHYQITGYNKSYECELLHRDGRRFPYEVCGMTVPYQGRQARITALRDITNRKQAEADREALITELEARNDELERFAYTISHDLKAPLITIRGFLKWVERDAKEGNLMRLHENLRRIDGAAGKMEHLMDSLLRLSRSGEAANLTEDILFEELARDAVELVTGRMIESGVTISIQPNLPMVRGDKSRLLEVLLNLVDNAIKFMGNQAKPSVMIGARGIGTEAVFYVRDNGIGIAPQHHAQVLGLFEKLNPEMEGSGVGLALVKRIIEQHGGSFWVESEGLGKGSTFCFRLPQVRYGVPVMIK
jgi:two-component system, LuxR family, sensor kinase FixL